MESVDYFPIKVKQTSWENSSECLTDIRYNVFVEEQHVPINEEIDEDDPHAVHWIAYDSDNKAIATGRLLSNGQVGRMAVLKEFRGRGVGSSLMRSIIRYANREDIRALGLNSQIKAIPFYERFGFIVQKEPFMDAGILHQYMLLNLQNNQGNSHRTAVPKITEDERKRVSIEGIDAFCDQAEILIKRAHREIRIFSYKLEPALYSTDQLCDAIYAFTTSHPLARVNILVKDTLSVINHPNKLHELCQRLPSRISIKKFQSLEQCPHSEFLLIDRSGVLYKQASQRFVGYVTQHAPIEASALKDEFDDLWCQGEVDRKLKRLHL
jgi:predicted GNAT family N-acyltransferase